MTTTTDLFIGTGDIETFGELACDDGYVAAEAPAEDTAGVFEGDDTRTFEADDHFEAADDCDSIGAGADWDLSFDVMDEDDALLGDDTDSFFIGD